MLMYNEGMGILLEEEQKGFTIIEVMLFLALTGFLLAGILLGAGSSIANQRYKDAIQDATDVLRKAYSFVADTQIEFRDKNESACDALVTKTASSLASEAGRGRTSCAVYGAVVTINKDTIQTTTLLGKDMYDIMQSADTASADSDCEKNKNSDYCRLIDTSTTDLDTLSILDANNLVRNTIRNETIVAGNSATQKLKWSTYFRKPIEGEQNEGDDLKLTLLIFRSPRDGSIRTLAMNNLIESNGEPVDYRYIHSSDDPADKGVYKYLELGAFSAQDVYLCVDSGGAESYADHARMIRIMKNAHSQSGIKLEDFDAEIIDPSTGKEVLCDKN